MFSSSSLECFKSNIFCKIVIVANVFLVGCASPPPVRTLKLVEKAEWQVDMGPKVVDVVALPQQSILELFKQPSNRNPSKGKFENDMEYVERLANLKKPVFLVSPLATTKEKNCDTVYDHQSQTYTVKNCLPFLASRPVIEQSQEGEPLKLANAFDSRTVRRIRDEKYFIRASVDWTQTLVLSREEAQDLDSDLMAGIVLETFDIASKTCELCALRDLSDALTRKSSAGGWKDDAFKSGSVYEDWVYVATTQSFKELVIFRRSNGRVLYRAQYAFSDK